MSVADLHGDFDHAVNILSSAKLIDKVWGDFAGRGYGYDRLKGHGETENQGPGIGLFVSARRHLMILMRIDSHRVVASAARSSFEQLQIHVY